MLNKQMVVAGRVKAGKTWICLLLILAVGMLIWMQYNRRPVVVVQGTDGVWDLRGVNLAEDCVRLSGPIEYVPGALLTPEAFDASSDVTIGNIPDYCEFLTSRIRLLVPEDAVYEMAGFANDFGSSLYINGAWRLDVGKPATTKEENVPMEGFVIVAMEADGGVIEIVEQTSNFVFRSNTSHTGWIIGHQDTVGKWVSTITTAHSTTLGLYLALFLVYMLLYNFVINQRAMLWLGLLNLVWAARMSVTGMRPLLNLLPWNDWAIYLRIEYCTVLAALVLIALCYSELFPGVFPKALQWTVYTSQGLFALLYLFGDTLFISKTMIAYEITAISCGLWAIICLLRHQIHRQGRWQKIIVLNVGLVIVGLALDTIYYNEITLPFINSAIMEAVLFIFSFFHLAGILLMMEERIIRTQEAEAHLALENTALDRINRLREDMMATFSHEMRTPLAVMMGFVQLTAAELREKNISEQAVRDLDAIAEEARRMKQLVEEMQQLSLARVAKEERQPLDIGPIVTQICRMYAPIAERKQTRLTVAIGDPLPLAIASMDGLTQVLFNLLNNADRHTHHGEIRVQVTQEGHTVRIAVSDTGTGIAPEQIPHVFDRYSKGENGGLGMGLTICKELVEGWGGQIAIESVLDEGTTVFVILLAVEGR